VFRGTFKEELLVLYLRSFRLERGAPMYVCDNQESDQWLITATDDHRLGPRARLMALDAKIILKPVLTEVLKAEVKAQQQEECGDR
jgi:hypothetical protein